MYYLAKLIQKTLEKLPLGVCLLLGQLIGFILSLNRKKWEISFKNIKSIFPQKSNREIKAIIRRSFRNFGLGLIESLIAAKLYRRIELRGKENIESGGGVLVAIHEGSWELYNFFIAKQLKYKMFAKEQKQKNFDKFLSELRKKYSLGVCFTLKKAIQALYDGFLIGMVIDHGAEDNALIVDFFSHSVPTPKGAVYLAKKLNKKIYPCFGYRKKGFSHVIEIGKPINPAELDEYALLTKLNKIYENYLKEYPWEYLWFYKRFKRKKDMDILILSDGKAGHLKQSQAFLSVLKEEHLMVRGQVIEIKPTGGAVRFISEVCAFFAGKHCLGCGSCLNRMTDKEAFEKIKRTYADIIVSTGSSVAYLNRIIASTLGAKSVVILRPNTPLRKFDLSIIPSHDRISANNSVTIKGALSYPEDVNEKTENCKKFFHLDSNKKISFFAGGYLSDKKKYLENLQLFLKELKKFSSKNNFKLLASTSRRTQKEIEELIEKELYGFKNCEAIVIPSKENYDFVFEGFVNLSEIVFVSSESISMISEILALKKPCVCVLLEQYVDKHKVFLQSLEKDVFFSDNPYNIDGIKPTTSSIFDNNKAVIKEAIRKLF
ncbi:MAG: mitochondrial fission ELM1 family protein [Candidatus Omnitrophica bacterium]|jgi:lauroyl/myristoyl acyltransferase|nr:mitochondrial fission ELM1 family protein [Candidatus Omnitrophota bacterium]